MKENSLDKLWLKEHGTYAPTLDQILKDAIIRSEETVDGTSKPPDHDPPGIVQEMG